MHCQLLSFLNIEGTNDFLHYFFELFDDKNGIYRPATLPVTLPVTLPTNKIFIEKVKIFIT